MSERYDMLRKQEEEISYLKAQLTVARANYDQAVENWNSILEQNEELENELHELQTMRDKTRCHCRVLGNTNQDLYIRVRDLKTALEESDWLIGKAHEDSQDKWVTVHTSGGFSTRLYL